MYNTLQMYVIIAESFRVTSCKENTVELCSVRLFKDKYPFSQGYYRDNVFSRRLPGHLQSQASHFYAWQNGEHVHIVLPLTLHFTKSTKAHKEFVRHVHCTSAQLLCNATFF